MATNPSELFIVIAQMSVAFAGFGSLASRLGRQDGGDDARVDATRLNLMLFTSLSATMLGVLPSTLSGLILDDRLAVRSSALVALFGIVVYAATGVRRALNLRRALGFSRAGVLSNLACTFIALAAFILCVLDLPAGRTEAVYLLGLVGLLGSSIIMFSRVIVSMLRPHDQGGRQA
ncbi:MAG TPA: hypothetical protein VK192_08015 [Sphingomicrobium sp.]|jgi:hypothetical protein|nr:hypothetical protein [Sphingomicrobium sp.]